MVKRFEIEVVANSTDLVFTGPWFLVIFLSMFAGFVSFASPCIIPLVPGYIAFLSSLQEEKNSLRRTLTAVFLFILGFTIIFVAVSTVIFSFTQNIKEFYTSRSVEIVGGILTIIFGIIFSGKLKFFQKEMKLKILPNDSKLIAAPILGAIFAIGWTPCVGPTLGSILTLATVNESGAYAKPLSYIVFYCLGLGLPFLILATGSMWATKSVNFLKRNTRKIQLFGSYLLIFIGILLITGIWNNVLIHVKTFFPNFLVGI